MKTFHAILRETNHLDLTIKADNEDEAIKEASRLYGDGVALFTNDNRAYLDIKFKGDQEYNKYFLIIRLSGDVLQREYLHSLGGRVDRMQIV